MSELLLPDHAHLLTKLAAANTLLAFDYDGTLSPINPNRGLATMRSRTQVLFERVCQLYPTALISGRSRSDVAERISNAAVKYIVGNHGLEMGEEEPLPKVLLDEARERLGALVTAAGDIELEDKGYSLAVHYRRAEDPVAVEAAVLAITQTLTAPAMRIIPGKCVLNLVPAGAHHKGDALVILRAQARADFALYVGDDVTDEDVFRLRQPQWLVTVRVGELAESAATYFLRDQHQIDPLLSRLISLREKTQL